LRGSVESPDHTSEKGARLNRFSTGIAKGDIYRARWQDRFEKTVRRPFSMCRSGGGGESRRFFEIFFSLPFPAGTANTPENVGKKRMFSTEPVF